MTQMTPLVSVVICNYNYGRFLDEAIRSALNQTYKRIEIIVVDDGSTDNSGEVLERQPSEVVILHTQRQGQAGALWAGVKASRGDIICFLDSDDVWLPTKLEELVVVFSDHPDVAWVRHKLAVTDVALRLLGPYIPQFAGSGCIPDSPHLYLERTVSVSTSALSLRRALAQDAFARLAVLLGTHGERSSFGGMLLHADACLLTLIGTSRVKGFSLDRPLGYYRRHAGQQFCGPEGVVPMLHQQIEVGRMISQIWSAAMGNPAIGSHVYKHLLVVDALRAHSMWNASRLKVLLDGLKATTKFRNVKLGLRQAGAILFAYIAPRTWTRRLLARQGYL